VIFVIDKNNIVAFSMKTGKQTTIFRIRLTEVINNARKGKMETNCAPNCQGRTAQLFFFSARRIQHQVYVTTDYRSIKTISAGPG
jgi:hypothetical protein